MAKVIIEIEKIPDNLGGGYTACVPELGRMAVIGDGESAYEALYDMFNHYHNKIQARLDEDKDEQIK